MTWAAVAVGGANIANSFLKSKKGGRNAGRPADPALIEQQLGFLPTIRVPDFRTINSPGFSFSQRGGRFSLNRDSAALNLFDARAPGFFANIDDLRARFKPGFSEVRAARLGATTAARQRGLSNLRDSLSQRRVQGSSFARAEEIQGENQFAQLEAEQQAQSFLEEVAINSELLKVELQGFNSLLARADQDLRAFATAAGVATNFSNIDAEAQASNLAATVAIIQSLNGLASNAARIQTQLDIANAEGFGEFAGSLAEGFGNSNSDDFDDGGGIPGAETGFGGTIQAGSGRTGTTSSGGFGGFGPTTTGNINSNLGSF